MTEINPGDVRRVSGSFTNPAGVATDPTTISVRWRHHRGTETTWVYGTDTQVVRDSAGVFHADIPITVSGLYYYKFEGTGAVQAAEEGTFLAETFFESVAPSTLTGPIRLYTGTADPTTGAGVPATIGSVYSRTLLGSESVWVKTGAADTGWVQAGAVTGGGSGLPDTWTVSGANAVTAETDGTDVAPLTIKGQVDQAQPLFDVVDSAFDNDHIFQVFGYKASQFVVMKDWNRHTFFSAQASPDGSVGEIQINSDQSDTTLTSNGSTTIDLAHDRVLIGNNGGIARVDASRVVFLHAQAAPADADLGLAGSFALWFDSTNGAPKLMVKAKQADGTIVSGEVALT